MIKIKVIYWMLILCALSVWYAEGFTAARVYVAAAMVVDAIAGLAEEIRKNK